MVFKEFITTILRSFNPASAKYLTAEKKLVNSFVYFFALLFLTLFITTLLFIPTLLKYPKLVDDKIAKFDNLSITFNGEMNSQLIISEKPLILVDTSKNNITNEFILVSKDKTYFSWLFVDREYDVSYTNILNSPEKIKNAVMTLTILLAPGIWIAIYLALAAKYILIILIAVAVSLIALKIAKREIRFTSLLKAGIYTSTIMILLDLIPKPFMNMRFIPILVFGVLFAITAWMMSQVHGDKRGFDIKVREKVRQKEEQKKPRREQDIGFEKY